MEVEFFRLGEIRYFKIGFELRSISGAVMIRDIEGPVINLVCNVPNSGYVVLGRPGEVAPLRAWRRG